MYESHDDIPLHIAEMLEEIFKKDVEEIPLEDINALAENNAELFQDDEDVEQYAELDGDLETGLASAGWGTNEDYGLFDGD